MDFLRSETGFKAAAQRIEQYLSSISPNNVVKAADLIEILLPLARFDGGQRLLRGSHELADALNKRNHVEFGRGQILQQLSHAFGGQTYQGLRQGFSSSTEFRQLFPDAALPSCSLSDNRPQVHPFPGQLHKLSALAPWRTIWEQCAVSTRDRPFFPPMLPASYFRGYRPNYELRRDWRPSSKKRRQHLTHHFENGRCCVLVRHEGRQLIGAASWKWWGCQGHINGVGFSLFVQTKSGWLKIYFDLRPYYAEPTYGPQIYRAGGNNADHIAASLEELIHLRQHGYPDEFDPEQPPRSPISS